MIQRRVVGLEGKEIKTTTCPLLIYSFFPLLSHLCDIYENFLGSLQGFESIKVN